MPSLPALPIKNPSIRSTAATNVLYSKALREYLARDFSSALSTIAIFRSQPLSPKSKLKCFQLYLAILDSVTSLNENDLKLYLGRGGTEITEKLRGGTVWDEAEDYFDGHLPISVSVNLILSLTRHMVNTAKLQERVEVYLTSIEPDTDKYDSISELYALHVLPRCGDWDSARGYIESCDMSDDRREAWLKSLNEIKVAQDQEKVRYAHEAEEQKKSELEAKKLRRVRKSRSTSSKKSANSVNGSRTESTKLPGLIAGANHVDANAESSGDTMDLSSSEKRTTTTTLASLTSWTKAFTLRISPRIFKILLFMALLFGATGRREIRQRIFGALKRAGTTIAAGFKVSYV